MNRFMQAALREAKKSLSEGGIPIGAVLVKKGRIVGRGHNLRVQKGNPLMHAEIACIMDAGRLKSYSGTVLYSTLMPCFLCAGAIVQFGIPEVIAGESRSFKGARRFLEDHKVRVSDLSLKECTELMRCFIKSNPRLWKEDIGKL